MTAIMDRPSGGPEALLLSLLPSCHAYAGGDARDRRTGSERGRIGNADCPRLNLDPRCG